MNRRLALAAAAALLLSCAGAYQTAPSGSTMVLVANPMNIASHGGVSELMAIVTEPAGTDVPDGTVVLWTTNLGHVDRETRTERGIARNRLVSDSRSGIAHVTAQSGSDALPPTTPPSTTPGSTFGPTTTNPTSTTTTTIFFASGVAGASALSGTQVAQAVDINVGNALVRFVRIRAQPTRITNSSTTHVIATVTDESGNPVANVPVFFEVIRDRDTDFFESAGAAVFTNNNGEAEDILRTRRTVQGPPIQVQASAAGGTAGFVPSNVLEIPVL